MSQLEQKGSAGGEASTGAGVRGKFIAFTTIVLGIAAVALIAVAMVTGFGEGDGGSTADAMTHVVSRSDMVVSFNERGNVKAARSTQIFCRLEGMSTIVSVADEGTVVREGDLLVELDSSSLQQELNNQEIQVQSALADLVQAKEEFEIQKSQNQSDLEAAEVTLELADLDLNKYREKEYPLAVAMAEADIFLASEELERARNTYEWSLRLAKKGYISKTKLIADEIAMKRFTVQKSQAQGNLELLEQFTHKKEIRNYESQRAQAEAALGRTKSQNRAILAKAQADVAGKESTYSLSVKRLQKLRDQMEKTKIYAPQQGMVVYHQDGRRRNEERMIEQGASVRENQHLIDLPDVSQMAVTVQVHESQVDQVMVGTPALINVDALPHLNLKGTVTEIGVLPDSVNRWLNPDLKVYRTEIVLEKDPGVAKIKPGMSANVTLVVARLRDVLSVPVQSVTTIDGEHHCFVLDGSGFTPRKVTIGLHNKSFVQIKDGLTEGDIIQLDAPKPEGTRSREDAISDSEIPDVAAGDEEGGRRPRNRPEGGAFPGRAREGGFGRPRRAGGSEDGVPSRAKFGPGSGGERGSFRGRSRGEAGAGSFRGRSDSGSGRRTFGGGEGRSRPRGGGDASTGGIRGETRRRSGSGGGGADGDGGDGA